VPLDLAIRGRVLHLDAHDPPACAEMARAARDAGAIVTADIDNIYEGLPQLLPLIDVLITSSAFPHRLTGISDERAALVGLKAQYGCAIVGATLGTRGAVISALAKAENAHDDVLLALSPSRLAGEIEQVFLYNIDDLQASVRENLAKRASEMERAEKIVDEELEKFAAWLRSRGVIPTVVALRQSFESIRRAELDRLDFKLSGLPPEARDEARARVDEITHLIIEKLLLTPTEQLKALGNSETVGAYAEALTKLFALADQHADDRAERERPAKVEPFKRPTGGRR
jgi:hypothetical protein